MNIKEKFLSIMENDIAGFNDLIGEVKDMLEEQKSLGNIKDYSHELDMDVYDSCGLDIYYLSIAWVDNDGKLNVAGTSYWSY